MHPHHHQVSGSQNQGDENFHRRNESSDEVKPPDGPIGNSQKIMSLVVENKWTWGNRH